MAAPLLAAGTKLAGSTVAKEVGQAAASSAAASAVGGLFRPSVKKLTKQAKEMALFNDEINRRNAQEAYERQLELNQIQYEQNSWQNQVKQLEEAGLNKSMMLGGGGTTGTGGGAGQGASTPQAQAATGQAPDTVGAYAVGNQAMGMALQMQMMEAQKEAMKAQANKDNADADSTRGVEGTTGSATIKKLIAEVDNLEVQKKLTETSNRIAEIDEEIKSKSKEDIIDTIGYEMENVRKEFELLDNQIKRDNLDTELYGEYKNLQLENMFADVVGKYATAEMNESQEVLNGQLKDYYHDLIMLKANGQEIDKEVIRNDMEKLGIILNNENLNKFMDRIVTIGTFGAGAIGYGMSQGRTPSRRVTEEKTYKMEGGQYTGSGTIRRRYSRVD